MCSLLAAENEGIRASMEFFVVWSIFSAGARRSRLE
jgi:hypothetical protein